MGLLRRCGSSGSASARMADRSGSQPSRQVRPCSRGSPTATSWAQERPHAALTVDNCGVPPRPGPSQRSVRSWPSRSSRWADGLRSSGTGPRSSSPTCRWRVLVRAGLRARRGLRHRARRLVKPLAVPVARRAAGGRAGGDLRDRDGAVTSWAVFLNAGSLSTSEIVAAQAGGRRGHFGLDIPSSAPGTCSCCSRPS